MNEILYVGPSGNPFLQQNIGNIIECSNESEALEIAKSEKLRAIIEDGCYALQKKFKLANVITDDPVLQHIPVIAVINEYTNDEALAFLEAGFSDILSFPISPILLQKRIMNAIKSAGSLTFDEMASMLKELPSNIYLKDKKGRYIFATHYWDHIYHEDPHFSIRGKTDLEIRKNKENAKKAMEADERIINNGTMEQYVIYEDTNKGGQYLELIKCPVRDSVGNITGIVGLINDVTKVELLKKELEKKSNTDGLTGLFNKTCVKKHIEGILPLIESGAFFMIDLDNFKMINDTFGHNVGDNVLAIIGDLLKISFDKGIVGRFGGDEFIAFVKDISPQEARKIAEDFSGQVKAAFGGKLKGKVGSSIGISMYPKNGETFRDLYKNADNALYQVKGGNKGGVIVA